ncbi:MAG: hypothetical protein WC626_08975 [Methanoregula sp.]
MCLCHEYLLPVSSSRATGEGRLHRAERSGWWAGIECREKQYTIRAGLQKGIRE